MSLRLYDTRTRSIRDFEPLVAGKVGIYVCGPPVQAEPHIGHVRAATALDALRNGFAVTVDSTATRGVDVAARLRGLDQVAHRRQAPRVDLQRDAEDVLDDDLEGSTGAGERREVCHGSGQSAATRSCCTTSKLHSSEWDDTGPSELCALWP